MVNCATMNVPSAPPGQRRSYCGERAGDKTPSNVSRCQDATRNTAFHTYLNETPQRDEEPLPAGGVNADSVQRPDENPS